MGAKRNQKHGYERFVKLDHWMLRSEAWRSLSVGARALYVEVVARHNGNNNGDIAYSHREAVEALNVGYNAPTRLFKELQGTGFLVATARGAFSRKSKEATTWRLTAEPVTRDGKAVKEATKDFMKTQNTVTSSVTVGHSQRDRPTKTVTPRLTVSHSDSDREHPNDRSHGHSYSDTYSIPGGPGNSAGASHDSDIRADAARRLRERIVPSLTQADKDLLRERDGYVWTVYVNREMQRMEADRAAA